MSTRARANVSQDQHPIYRMLHHLGWSLAALPEREPLNGVVRGTAWQPAPLPDGGVLLLVFLPQPLPDLRASFAAYEDLAPLHRDLQAALAKARIAGRHCLLLDNDHGAQLLDLVQEDVLLDVRGEDDASERLLPLLHLNALAKGSLSTFPRKAARQRARELAEWTKVWSARLGAGASVSPEAMRVFFDWLLLSRLAGHHGLAGLAGNTFADYALSPKLPHPVKFLDRFFVPLRDGWNLLQGSSLKTMGRFLVAAHGAEQLAPCLRSFAHLSRSKFAADLYAEAFADEEIRLLGWRVSLMEAPPPPELDAGRWLAAPLPVDLDRTGFPALLRGFDAVANDLQRLAREQAVATERGERPGLQLDLLGAAPPTVQEEDAPRFTLQHGLRVRTEDPRRAAVARLVLLARAAEWQARLRRPEPVFPSPHVDSPEGKAPRFAPAPVAVPKHPEWN